MPRLSTRGPNSFAACHSLSSKQYQTYSERKAIAARISELEATIRDLKKRREALDADILTPKLLESLESGAPVERSLPDGRVLQIVRITVNKKPQPAITYSFIKFKELVL